MKCSARVCGIPGVRADICSTVGRRPVASEEVVARLKRRRRRKVAATRSGASNPESRRDAGATQEGLQRMHHVRQENLPFVGSSREFVGAEQGDAGVSVFLFHGRRKKWRVASTRKDTEKAAAGLPHSKWRALTPESGVEPPHSRKERRLEAGATNESGVELRFRESDGLNRSPKIGPPHSGKESRLEAGATNGGRAKARAAG